MARIRTVKPEFFQHEEIGALPFAARLLAIGLMQIADGHGRLRWVPKQIEAHVFPWDDVDLEALAVGLESVGILIRYRMDGRDFAAFPNFRKHQRITGKEAAIASKYPGPEGATNYTVNTQERPGETPRYVPGKQLDVQEQGTGNREQGTGIPKGASAPVVRSSDSAPTPNPVWASWREFNPSARKTPTAGQRKTIKARLTEYTAEEIADYFRWLRESPHKRAVFCRTEGHDGWGSVTRPGNMDERMQWVREWNEAGTPATAEPVSEPAPERTYKSWSWFEGELNARARELEMTPEQITPEWARRHKDSGQLPAWAFDRAIENVKEERA